MPTRKRRLSKPAVTPKIQVTLMRKEMLKIGRECLGIVDASEHSERLEGLQPLLDMWACALANVPAVTLRSDLLSRAQPLAKRVHTLRTLIRREQDLLTFAAYERFIDPVVLIQQLDGFDQLVTWIKEEKPKRGGERRSFRKQVNDDWKARAGAWFDDNTASLPQKGRSRRRTAFLRLVQAAVERALKKP